MCKILAAHEVRPHKVRYYLERRDPEFEPKLAEVLCVYRDVEMRRVAGGAGEAAIAVVSYDRETQYPSDRHHGPPTFARCPAAIRRSAAITSTSGMGR